MKVMGSNLGYILKSYLLYPFLENWLSSSGSQAVIKKSSNDNLFKAIRALGRGYWILCIAPKALIVYSIVAYIA